MLKLVAKPLVAVLLLALLIWQVDWAEASALLGRISPATLLVVLAAMLAELALSVWKWSCALRIHGLGHPYAYLFRTAATGYFLNNFLPTSVGGDAFRVYRTLPADGYRSRAVSAVLVDRATGLGALLTLGALGALRLWPDQPLASAYLSLYLAGGVGAAVGLLALKLGLFERLTARIQHLKPVDAIRHNAERLLGAGRAWALQIGLAFAFQLISASIVFWLFQRTGPAMPFSTCALIAAAAGLAGFLPISLNGIGLVESSFVAMAVGLGADYDQAVLVALVRRLMIVFLSLLCGLVYLSEGRPSLRPRREERAAET